MEKEKGQLLQAILAPRIIYGNKYRQYSIIFYTNLHLDDLGKNDVLFKVPSQLGTIQNLYLEKRLTATPELEEEWEHVKLLVLDWAERMAEDKPGYKYYRVELIEDKRRIFIHNKSIEIADLVKSKKDFNANDIEAILEKPNSY